MIRQVPIAVVLVAVLVAVSWLEAAPATAAACGLIPLSSSQEGEVLTVVIEMHEQCESTLRLYLDGERANFDIVRAEGSRSRLVIAMESSDSLAPGDHDLVVNAVKGLLRQLDDSTEVGLVSYGSGARLDVPPTTEHGLVIQGVEKLESAGGAALYSGVAEAARATQGAAGPAAIILFTYGWDWGGVSTENVTESLEVLEFSGVPLYVQSLVPADEDIPYLSQLSTDAVIHRGADLPHLEQALGLLQSEDPWRYRLQLDLSLVPSGDHSVLLEAGGEESRSLRFLIESPQPPVAPAEVPPPSTSRTASPNVGPAPSSMVNERPGKLEPSEPPPSLVGPASPIHIGGAQGLAPGAPVEDVVPSALVLLFVVFSRRRWRLARERSEEEAVTQTRRARYRKWLIAT